LEEEIETRRRDGNLGEDLLGDVLRDEPELPADAIADELLVLFMAAQEPPSIALTRLLCVSEAHDDVGIREVLRLSPPAIGSFRRLTAARDVGGHRLPVGVTVMVPIPLLHRDPRAFPEEPDAFRPQRWVSGAADEAAYLPFGGGARRCVGEPLAHLYFDTLLPSIRRRVDIRPLWPGAERSVVRGTQLVPHRGGLARVRPR